MTEEKDIAMVIFICLHNTLRNCSTQNSEDVVKAQYGDNPPEDAEIYIQIMRQPSYKEDNYHIMPIKIATWDNAAAISMTESTARHHHGRLDGDGVSFSVSKDITNYGSKISKHVNLELNILDDVTKFLPLKTKAELNGYDKKLHTKYEV